MSTEQDRTDEHNLRRDGRQFTFICPKCSKAQLIIGYESTIADQRIYLVLCGCKGSPGIKMFYAGVI